MIEPDRFIGSTIIRTPYYTTMDNNDPLVMFAAAAQLKQTEESLHHQIEELQNQIMQLQNETLVLTKEIEDLKHPTQEEETTEELQQLPNESKEFIQKRRQRVYNKRAYRKQVEREQKQQLNLETTFPTSVAHIPADNPSDKSLLKVISAIRKEHPEKWTSFFRKNGDIRLLTVVHYLNESHPGIMVEKAVGLQRKYARWWRRKENM